MAAASCSDPAAERRIFKTLRKMAQREVVRLQLCLKRWPVGAALDQRSARRSVDVDPFPHRAQTGGPRAFVPVARRPPPATNARAAAKWRDRRVRAGGPVEHRSDIGLAARI